MAKEAKFNLHEVVLIKLAVFFATTWLIGLLVYWILPSRIMAFIVEWRWAAFALMIIFGVKPAWKWLFKQDIKGKNVKKKRAGKKGGKNSRRKKK